MIKRTQRETRWEAINCQFVSTENPTTSSYCKAQNKDGVGFCRGHTALLGMKGGGMTHDEHLLETVIDILEAPGRHVTSWDGGWTDEVAQDILELIRSLRTSKRISKEEG